jgi:ribose 5-phosphate isomerase A
MSIEDRKRRAAHAALEWVRGTRTLGIGAGTTVDHFLEALAPIKGQFDGAVSSSEATTTRLRQIGIPALDLNTTGELEVYVDGADQADRYLRLIKGGGGALTREKVVAAASRKFVCLIDDDKLVDHLGEAPVPVEVIPMARSFVARQLIKLGGRPAWRENFVTDNGNAILDVNGLKLTDPGALEERMNSIPGIVSVGIFARRPADVLLIGGDDDVKTLKR